MPRLPCRHLSISIHSLVKRETKIVFKLSFNVLYFNPLPRKEGDSERSCFCRARIPISIHSLVKRETASGIFHVYRIPFQSTPS